MRPESVALFACPECGSEFKLAGESLICPRDHTYPIVDGIPRFVDSELYAGNFGFEWTLHASTQLDTSRSDESERTFRAKTGFTPEELRGKTVLDVGCGMGRFSDVASRWGANVVAIDLSRAVESAQRNIGGRPNVTIAQANVFALPFREQSFDYIFSIGVLHHTPDTKAAFDRLPNLLRPGGKIAIWLYEKHRLKWGFSDFYRLFTPKLPKRFLHAVSYLAVPLYYAYKIPVLGLAIHWVLPAGDHPKARWRVLDTFDWYSPTYQWKHTYPEVRGWFNDRGLVDVSELDVPVAVQGRRPGGVAQANAASQPNPATITTQ